MQARLSEAGVGLESRYRALNITIFPIFFLGWLLVNVLAGHVNARVKLMPPCLWSWRSSSLLLSETE